MYNYTFRPCSQCGGFGSLLALIQTGIISKVLTFNSFHHTNTVTNITVPLKFSHNTFVKNVINFYFSKGTNIIEIVFLDKWIVRYGSRKKRIRPRKIRMESLRNTAVFHRENMKFKKSEHL